MSNTSIVKIENSLEPIKILGARVKSLTSRYPANVLRRVTRAIYEPLRAIEVDETDFVSALEIKKADPITYQQLAQAIGEDFDGLAGVIIAPQNEGDSPTFVPFRNNDDKARALIGRELVKIARSFGARGAIPPEVLSYTVNLVFNQFKSLGVAEIATAFELAAAGKIKANTTLYGGVFSVDFVGDVLRAYNEYRAKIVVDIHKLDDIEKREQEKERKRKEAKEKNRQALEKDIERFVEIYKTGKEALDALWARDYDTLCKLGLPVLSSDRKYQALDAVVDRVVTVFIRIESKKGTKAEVYKGKVKEIRENRKHPLRVAASKQKLARDFFEACYKEGLTVASFRAHLADRLEENI